MIVIGADTHKSTHTLAAVDAATGRVVATKTVGADRDGMLAAWRWAHRLDGERGVGDRGLRARAGALGALPDRRGRAGGARRAKADGPGAPRASGARASPMRSTRS